ncbi:MAG: IPT/TIG domain-containing protein [Candidatus Melainabacteria bacterium]|jgi:hypothetical protein|nr:IPT/TIG domain-containing protein [Candidatus Melainabacteria bacterium]
MKKVATVQSLVSAFVILSVQGAATLPVFAQLKQAPPAVSTPPAAAKPAEEAKEKKDDNIQVIQESKPIVQTAKGWQTFTDYINIKAGQDTAPLTLTFNNGSATALPFESMQIFLAGRLLGTEKKFKSRVLTMDMTGALGAGGTQMIIKAFGPQGASMNWQLTTPKIAVTSMTPKEAAPGDKISIVGKNFGKGLQVQMGKQWAKVVEMTATKLTVEVPAEIEGGKQMVVVSQGGLKGKAQELNIKAAPSVTGIDTLSAPPGQTVNITGKGFSATSANNTVTFNGTPGSVVSASTTQLSVVIPEIAYPQWDVQIKVKTNGQESKDHVKINVQQRVIENSGVPEQ